MKSKKNNKKKQNSNKKDNKKSGEKKKKFKGKKNFGIKDDSLKPALSLPIKRPAKTTSSSVLEKTFVDLNRAARTKRFQQESENEKKYLENVKTNKKNKRIKINENEQNLEFSLAQRKTKDSSHFIIGESLNIEKSYYRLTGSVNPVTIRPKKILKKSLQNVIHKHKTASEDYSWCSSQLKAIRQDLMVQGIKTKLTVKVYEVHARIALEQSDLAEFNQCQIQLKALYSAGLKSENRAEFLAYYILYLLYTDKFTAASKEIIGLASYYKDDPAVKNALLCRYFMSTGNYVQLFRLYEDVPNLGGYLFDSFILRERKKAFAKMISSNLTLETSYVQKILAFESVEEWENFKTFVKVVEKGKDKSVIDCKSCLL